MGIAGATSAVVQTLTSLATSVGEALANVATSASVALPNADPTPSTLGLDPGEKAQKITWELLDLKIPNSLRDWLTPPLASLGFSIEPKEVQGTFSPKRSYNLIRNAVGQHSLFHIPNKILEDGSNWEAVGSVISVLRLKKQVLIVVSEGLENTNVAYKVVGRPLWLEDAEVSWTFVPWGDLQAIKPMPADDQRAFLPNLLQLEELLEEARKLPVCKVTDAEIGTLANILSLLPEFIDNGEQAWRLRMGQAGLKELTGMFDFGGAPKIVAFGVISQLRNYAVLPDRPRDQVLGRLLCQVLTIADLRPDDANEIKNVLKTYNLAPSLIDF